MLKFLQEEHLQYEAWNVSVTIPNVILARKRINRNIPPRQTYFLLIFARSSKKQGCPGRGSAQAAKHSANSTWL